MAGSSGWFVEETVQRRLELSAATFASNQFGCTIRAAPGQAVVMEAFSNLVNWIPIQSNLATSSGEILFSDPESGLLPHRFYRARLE